jgi:hypothetical protein
LFFLGRDPDTISIGEFTGTSVPVWAFAQTVAALVVDQNVEAFGEGEHDGMPTAVVAPGTVDQHQRRAIAAELIEQLNAINRDSRRGSPR